MSRLWVVLVCLLPGLAWAGCPAGEAMVFSCRTDTGKEARVCQAVQTITYRFGSSGKPPELTLVEKNAVFAWAHGEGVGSGIGDDLTFRSPSAEYTISHIAAFNDPTDRSAHITVKERGKDPVFVSCVSGIAFNPKAIRAKPQPMDEAP